MVLYCKYIAIQKTFFVFIRIRVSTQTPARLLGEKETFSSVKLNPSFVLKRQE